MAPSIEATMPSTRRSRKSIGGSVSMKRSMDKENATVDVAGTLAASRQRSRSKSMGPGGLDALKHGHGNRRASIATPMPRSILKPTAYSVQEIPPLKGNSRRKRRSTEMCGSTNTSGSASLDSADNSKVALRSEEEQQAATREREEQERRDARRKSLANRRVSFAAEATLHTFHEIDYLQDSTTSTDSTRRASSINGAPSFGTVPKSPDHHEIRRQSPAPHRMGFASNDDDTFASTVYSSDSESADAVEEDDVEENSGSSSDSDDGTMMTIENVEVTGTTVSSERYDSGGETSTLDRALRAATERAGAQKLDSSNAANDEMDDGEEFIPSFGWVKKKTIPSPGRVLPQPPQPNDDDDTEMDMDMTKAVGKVLVPQDVTMDMTDQEMSMDVTQALGGILSQNTAKPTSTSGQSLVFEDDALTTDVSMDFTAALGRIRDSSRKYQDDSDTNEDFSMEFTAAMGGILPHLQKESTATTGQRAAATSVDAELMETEEAMMDMTVAYGGIIPPKHEDDGTVSRQDDTIGMDLTSALGGILTESPASSRRLSKRIMEEEADKPNSPMRAITAAIARKTPTRRSSRLSASSATSTPTGKPDSTDLSPFRGQGLRRSAEPQTPETISSPLRTPTPSPQKPTTPRVLKTPSFGREGRLTRSKSPQGATPQQTLSARTAQSPLLACSPKSTKSPRSQQPLFRTEARTGSRTPTVVLTPQPRRLSGFGADKSGLGSPRVTALLDRRCSIGESATIFVPGKREVMLESPKALAKELDEEMEDDYKVATRMNANAGHVTEQSQDKDATLNLREMIDNLTPKRNPPKGRKSLHVGSAKGLLGKRPVELDDGEDAEENDGVKRLKGHHGSPVKNIKLQQPPSVVETTGRPTRSKRQSLGPSSSTSMTTSPPSKYGRKNHTVHGVNLEQCHRDATDELKLEANDDRIHLQDFLDMTSIRFMELNTTKRRPTIAPKSLQHGTGVDDEDTLTLERCVVAAACTVPMLELYQHSCRELKNYIAEGRRIVKEIEVETFEVNPPLFQEYMSATPDVKVLMDTQFKNVKTHARLLSKAMWYEWRTKLQEGLREGLEKILEEMAGDEDNLRDQEDFLASILPRALARFEALEEEGGNLEEAARELADCDPAELEEARKTLSRLDADVEEKKKMIAQLQEQFESTGSEIDGLSITKRDLQDQIQKSEEVREACRGWTCGEVESLRARVDLIEQQHGWSVTGLVGTSLSMAYKREIEIVFDVAAFRSHQASSRIDLWYIGDVNDSAPAKMTDREFFLQCIRDHIRALPQSRTRVSDLLQMVGTAWDKARFVTSQITAINITFPTNVAKTSDSSVAVTSSLLLTTLRTRVETTLHLRGQSVSHGVDIGVSTQVKVIYGEHFNVSKVGEFLANRIGDRIGTKAENWSDVLLELQRRLIARGKKQVAG